MSTDLVFWRCVPLHDPEPARTYDELLQGLTPTHIEPLPTSEIADAIVAAFPGAVREPNGPREWVVWDPEDHNYMFDLSWSSHYVTASLRGPWPNQVPNRIIDVMSRFGLPLYDPQITERFDQQLT